MSDVIKDDVFGYGPTTQQGFRGYGESNPGDNLFQGMWKLGHDNLPEFEPFLTGYAFMIWTHLPLFCDEGWKNRFRIFTERDIRSFSGHSDLTLEFEEVTQGFGGNALPYATNMKKDETSFTMRFYEKAGSPIRNMLNYWLTGIRDPETGLATYHGKIEDGTFQYTAKNHVGELIYIVTDPSGGVNKDGSGIEYAEYWTNVIPTKIPRSHLDMEKNSHALVDIDVEFRGNWHYGQKVNELAVKAMEQYAIRKVYYQYDLMDKDILGDGYNEGTAS